MIVFSFVTTSINYYLLYRSYKKIKDIAETVHKVKVLRSGRFIDANSLDIVPGDLFIPGEEVSCDSIIVKGELFAN